MLKPGLVLIGEGHDFTDKIQYFVNGKGASHGCTITYPTGSKRDIEMVLSAEYNGVVHETWEKFCSDPTYNIWLYEVIGATQEEIDYALDYCEKTFLNDPYGWRSWPWFAWAALWKRALNPLGKKLHFKWLYHDVSKEHNWFIKGTFCTEHVWWFLFKLTELFPGKWSKLLTLLNAYYPDTIQPIDLKTMVTTNLDIFQEVNGQRTRNIRS